MHRVFWVDFKQSPQAQDEVVDGAVGGKCIHPPHFFQNISPGQHPVDLVQLDDGRVWAADLKSGRIEHLKAEKGPAISALAVSPDGSRLAWGDEDGGAGVVETGL